MLEDFAEATKELRAEYGEVLLGMDNLSSHQTVAFREAMVELDIVAAFTPADTTDMVAPVDHHCGALLKHLMSIFYHEAVKDHRYEWMYDSSALSASRRRMLMAEWLVNAWIIMQQQPNFFKQAFVSTGWLLKRDGSEMGKIKIDCLSKVGLDYNYWDDDAAKTRLGDLDMSVAFGGRD